MRLEKDANGWVARTQRSGWGSVVGAGMLGVVFLPWAVAELGGLAVVARMAHALVMAVPLEGSARDAPLGPVLLLLFLAGVLLLWTVGGLAVVRALLWLVSSEERLSFDRDGLTCQWGLGPWRWKRQVARAELVDVEHGGERGFLRALLCSGERLDLLHSGSEEERRDLMGHLREVLRLRTDLEHLADLTPDGWEHETRPEGGWVLRPARRVRERTLWGWGLATLYFGVGAAVLTGRLWVDGASPAGVLVALGLGVLAALTGAAARRAWRGGAHWVVLEGSLIHREPGRVRARYDAPELSVERTLDSDGDPNFALWLRASSGSRRLLGGCDSPRKPLHLGIWLARRVGVALRQEPPDLDPMGMPAKR